MTQTIDLPAPTVRTRERSITFRYDTGRLTEPSKYEKQRKILFTLDVSYTKAGINYFAGTVTKTDYYSVGAVNETEYEGVVGVVMGSGLNVVKIEQKSNRFSAKKLKELAAEWREKIEGFLALTDEEAEAHLDDNERVIRACVMPYWNGERAGLRG